MVDANAGTSDRADRVAHVVTYISADAAFGGPVAVATGQAAELARRGVHVDLFAAWDGVAQPDVPVGVRLRLFRARRIGGGLAGIFSVRLLIELHRALRRYRVVHVHVTRDLVCLPVLVLLLLRTRSTLLLQPHGQVRPDPRLAARLIDLAVVRPALRRARAVLVLTDDERELVRRVGAPEASIVPIANGVAEHPSASVARHGRPEVLFLARLHPRKQVMVFAEAARSAAARGLAATFVVVGPDGGDLARLQGFIREHRLDDVLRYGGSIPQERALATLASAHVYVLPSVHEVYPMTVLQAMSVGTPVVVTEDCGLSERLRRSGSALVIPPEADAVLTAVQSLVQDESLRSDLGARGLEYARAHFSIRSVVDRLLEQYGLTAPAGERV